ncbi:class A beta-lactamase-related serine hydrolase [Candidatus Parcubacteria bacterium]|nr:MAG: class A beta-lactamase-related serine hydrolase [Candidatus Parcubacteria bacterium]
MHKGVEERVKRAIQEKVFPGCVIGIIEDGKRDILPFGNFTYEPDSERVTEETVYDLASVTKSIPLASLAAIYIAEKKLSLSDTVKTYIPELQNDFGATIEDLLRYRVQGSRLSTLKEKAPDEILAHIFSRGFSGPPGKENYTNLPAFLLGLIMERVTGEILDALSEKHFFKPLIMKRTTFPNVRVTNSNIAPTEIGESGEEVRGVPHDESARVFARTGKAVGHAGLFSTAEDLLTFLEALLQGRYPFVVDAAQKGLGWQVYDPNFMGHYAGANTFGKTGFTGTSVVCDPERGIAFALLSNRTYPKRPPDQNAIFAFRRDIADILFQ